LGTFFASKSQGGGANVPPPPCIRSWFVFCLENNLPQGLYEAGNSLNFWQLTMPKKVKRRNHLTPSIFYIFI